MRSWLSLFHHASVRTILRGALTYLFGRRGQRRVAGLRLYYRLRMMVMLHSREPIGKLARLPEVRLWVDGREAFRRIEKLIHRARHTIVIQMFIWVDDATGRRIASALIDAADRGVQVDIAKDAVGDFFEVAGDFLGTRHSRHACWQRFWSHPRIRVSYGTQRDHAKVYVIDDQILLLTGMNVADEYESVYHDYLVELRGRRFVEQFLMRRAQHNPSDGVELVMNTEEERRIRPVLMGLLEGAHTSIVVEHGYLSDAGIVAALGGALRRGVRVTVILPASSDFHYYANMSSVGRLLSEGRGRMLRAFLFRGRIHGKVILVDHVIAFLGSANLLPSSLDDMGEVNVLVRGKHRFLWKLRETLREDILRSHALTALPPLLWLTRWMAWLGL